jgi:PPE-repeat protein
MYWGIPPEINAFRLTMMGAGPAAHVPVVAAYTDAMATHMEQAAQQAVTTAATAPSFVGSGGGGMVSAASPMSAWLGTAGAHAGAAAATVQGAIAGYSTAVASTIPHPVVIENRLREAALVASNILGQNTPAIAEAEAEYGEFWTQNASAMMGYLATTTAAVDALSVPLPPLTDMTSPVGAASGLAGLVSEGIGSGIQALGSGVSAGGQGISSAVGSGLGTAVSAGLSTGTSAGSGVQALGASSGTGQGSTPVSVTGAGIPGAASTAMAPNTPGTPSSSAPGTPSAPSAPGQGQGQGGQPPVGDSGQGLLNQVTEMAPQAMSAAESPLSSVAGLPAQAAGQFSGLLGPLSALTSGMSGGLGGGPGGGGPPPLSAANAPWSGLSGANGGYAGGGSDVSAALTKPSAGNLGGPVGLPGGWWANAAESAEDSAGAAAGLRSGAAARSAMAPGMYGPMGAVGRSGRSGAQHAEVSEADKLITLGSSAHDAPVLTSQGVVHVGQGG